jgi:Amt family ammonium transporter
MGEQLASWSLDHATAGDGPEALAMLREAASTQAPFGLAVLDTHLPGKDGEQLAAAIRADPLIGNTVLILITPAVACDAERLRDAGFAGWLTKPVRQSQLLDAIADALACARVAAPSLPERMDQLAGMAPTAPARAKAAGARILLAEDHEISQEVAATVLRKAGYRCDVAGNGNEAVDAARNHAYDLILMDCQMPEMDGYEASRTIRRLEEDDGLPGRSGQPIPIIALTANALKGDRERCLAAGMSNYLIKPLNSERLLGLLDEYLAPANARGDIQSVQSPERAGMPPDGSGAVDGDALRKRLDGDGELVRQVLSKFHEVATVDVEMLQKSVAAADAEQIAHFAHRFKGAAGYIAADSLRELAADLEATARASDLSGAEAMLRAFRGELDQCLEYIDAYLAAVVTTG